MNKRFFQSRARFHHAPAKDVIVNDILFTEYRISTFADQSYTSVLIDRFQLEKLEVACSWLP